MCGILLAGPTLAQSPAPQELPLQVPADPPAPELMVDESPDTWFVELSGATTSEGRSDADVEAEHQAFRGEAARSGAGYEEHRQFRSLFNGFSVRAPSSELAKLSRLPGVKAIHPVARVAAPEGPTALPAIPNLYTALGMTGADVTRSALGFTGKGIKVGIIDSGIDYDNPDLGGDGVARLNSPMFPNSRVVAGWDFVGDDFYGNTPPVPDAYPDDCMGHGTHVAGIIGANGVVTGVAPEAQLGSYRVFGCGGDTTEDVLLAAMERAFADGMDVVNMSFGSSYGWPQSPLAMAATRLSRHGVVVVTSAGNSGQTGLYSLAAPAVGKDVIAVASFDNVAEFENYFTVSPDATKIGWFEVTGAAPIPTSGTVEIARTATVNAHPYADACWQLPPGSLTGKVALIRRGHCTFALKAWWAQTAGAIGVVFSNYVPGDLHATTYPYAFSIPMVGISKEQGALLEARIDAGQTTITWTNQIAQFPNPTGNLVSSYSAYGLSPDLDLKPDLGAPGGMIYSTFPVELGGHASMSGTSMSSPHVAGAVALFLQAHPKTPPEDVRDLLQNSARPQIYRRWTALGLPETVSLQGAGLLRIDDAITSTVQIRPGKISLGDSKKGPKKVELRIENRGPNAITYDLSYVNAVSTMYTFSPRESMSDAFVTFEQPSVQVKAWADTNVVVTITPPVSGYPDQGQYGGYVVMTPQGGGEVRRVPFAGFIGDYQSIRVLEPTVFGLPWLAYHDPVTGYYAYVGGSQTYSMVGQDIPVFIAHFAHQSRQFNIDILDYVSDAPVGRVLSIDYWVRNSSPYGYYKIFWDGSVAQGANVVTVPNGQYKAKISVLKALGDPRNPAHWETWTSPLIRIKR